MTTTLNGTQLILMIQSASNHLRGKVQEVNALNVFPVPDGDTGTNMELTFSTGLNEILNRPSGHIGTVSEQLSRGLLMGARGNSGVILSQLFRGFGKFASPLAEMNAEQFATALQQGVETAYKAVVKPVEGTILTVAKEAVKEAVATASTTSDIVKVMQATYEMSLKALSKTPDQLPVLKQAGVVDSGGQGLVYIYEGMLAALKGQAKDVQTEWMAPSVQAEMNIGHIGHAAHSSAQSHWKTEDIEFGYCTEFLIQRSNPNEDGFDEGLFREKLEQYGDSLVVVADDHLVKVHIHAELPGEVMNFAMQYGGLTRIKIENMREQHSHIVESDSASVPTQVVVSETAPIELKQNGMIAVAVGEGIEQVFDSLGIDIILSGGQTMNPSTEQILQAIEQVHAHHVYILPNNPNIILAAQQAATLSNRAVTVIPTRTIPQGMAAALAFQADGEPTSNEQAMNRGLKNVSSGQVTYAVRDSQMDGLDIHKGDYLGVHDNRIVSADADFISSCRELLKQMVDEDSEIISVFYGQEANEEQNNLLKQFIESQYPDLELEFYSGGQPVYYYIFSVE